MRPDASFADVPIEVRRRVAGGERVALVLLDALGLRFLHRHDDHPLPRRLEITPLRSQFPSTTTALAAPGREVWLRSAPGNERWFRGQHGGLDPAETETYVAEVRPEWTAAEPPLPRRRRRGHARALATGVKRTRPR